MLICKECHKFLNEFDVNFMRNMNEKVERGQCKCFHCYVGKKNYADIEYLNSTKANIRMLKKWLLIGLACLLFSIVVMIYVDLHDSDYAYLMKDLSMYPFGVWFISGFVIAGIAVSRFKVATSEGGYTGRTIVTYNQVTDNSWSRSTEAEYVDGDDGSGKKFFYYATFIFWCIPYAIIAPLNCKSVSRKCPKELQTAYFQAKKETVQYSAIETEIQIHKQAKEKYQKEISSVRERYRYMDEAAVKEKENEITYPTTVFEVKQPNNGYIKYWLVDLCEKKYANRMYAFVLCRDEHFSLGGKIYDGEGYLLYLEEDAEEAFERILLDRKDYDEFKTHFEKAMRQLN